jgi:hypothetical protein
MLLALLYFVLEASGLKITENFIDGVVEFFKLNFNHNLERAWKKTIKSVAKECRGREKEILTELKHNYGNISTPSKMRLDERSFRGLMISQGITDVTSEILWERLKREFTKTALGILEKNQRLFRAFMVEQLNFTNENLERFYRFITKKADELLLLQKEALEILKEDREKLVRITNLILYPSRYHWVRSTKEIWIKNKDGDAILQRKLIGKNTSLDIMERLIWEVQHDGNLRIPTLRINETPIKPEIETSAITPKFGENDLVRYRLPYMTRIKVNLEPFRILPESPFSMEFTEDGDKMFRRMYEEDFTNINIKNLSDEIEFIVHSGKELMFVGGGISFEVRDEMGNLDRYEINRLRICPPELLEGNSILRWGVQSPLVGRNYTLKFRVADRQS